MIDWWGHYGLLVGPPLGAGLGFTIAYLFHRGDRTWMLSPRMVRAHLRMRSRCRNGVASLSDLSTFLHTSRRGRAFLLDAITPIVEYVRHRNETVTVPHWDWARGLPARPHTETEAVIAILYWLRHDPDWDLLLAALAARYSPAELVAHADGAQPITLEQARFLAALRAES